MRCVRFPSLYVFFSFGDVICARSFSSDDYTAATFFHPREVSCSLSFFIFLCVVSAVAASVVVIFAVLALGMEMIGEQ